MPSNAETRLLETKWPLLHTHERTLSEPATEVVLGGQARHTVLSVALYVGENVLIGQLVHTDEAVAENVPAPGGPLVDALAAGESTGHMSTNSSCCVTGCVNPCVRFAWESSALILWGGDVI